MQRSVVEENEDSGAGCVQLIEDLEYAVGVVGQCQTPDLGVRLEEANAEIVCAYPQAVYCVRGGQGCREIWLVGTIAIRASVGQIGWHLVIDDARKQPGCSCELSVSVSTCAKV